MRWITVFYDVLETKLLIILFLILFISFLILKIKNKKLFISILSVVYLSIFLCGAIKTVGYTKNDFLCYTTSEHSDLIVVNDDRQTALVFSGATTKSEAYQCVSELTIQRIVYLDKLILTDYSYGTPDFVDSFDNEIKCDTVYLPIPTNEEELKIAEKVAYVLSISNPKLKFYDNESPIKLSGTHIHLLHRLSLSDNRSKEKVLIITKDDKLYAYLSKGLVEDKLETVKDIVYLADGLILGKYGEDYSDGYIFYHKLDNLEFIYSGIELPIDANTETYYKEKGAPTETVNARIYITR